MMMTIIIDVKIFDFDRHQNDLFLRELTVTGWMIYTYSNTHPDHTTRKKARGRQLTCQGNTALRAEARDILSAPDR
jgi:hypothetical protein